VRDACLSVDELALYVGGSVPDDAVVAIVDHVESCERCRESIAAAVKAQRTRSPDAGDIAIGAAIGRYVVRAVRGSGAMGHVLEASDPDLDRVVAIKIVRNSDPGSDARALREGRALAKLAHANVVTVHDVGIWSGGVFLAMELVRGTTMREWAKSRSPREIARVFAAAARGIAAAHRMGLVHRDIKPDNLVVDDDGRVRVIDFGLAVASGDGALAGTPAYLAPEKRSDARSDQYAFMVSLHEAVTGERPGERELRPAWLRAIVERGLRSDPDARWPDMDAVAGAIERKLARGHGVIAAAGVLGLAGVAVAYVATRPSPELCAGGRAEMAAVWSPAQRAAIAATLPADIAAIVGARLDRYAAAWQDMHAAACEATRVRGEQSEELLDLRMSCLRTRLVEMRSLVELFAHADRGLIVRAPSAASSLSSLDDCADAKVLLDPVRPPRDPMSRARADAIADRVAVAQAQFEAGQIKDSRDTADAAVRDARALGHAPTLAHALFALASAQHRDGDGATAEQTFREAIRAAEAGRDDALKADAMIVMLLVGDDPSRSAAMIALAEDAKAVLQRLGGDDERTAKLLDNLGVILRAAGKLDEALADHQKALAIRERVLQPDDPSLAITANNVGAVLFDLGKGDEAMRYFERARTIWERAFGSNHPQVAYAYNNLGSVLWQQGKLGEALAMTERGLAIRKAALGADHPDTGVSVYNMGDIQRDLGRFSDALASYEHAKAIFEKALGTKHPLFAKATEMIGMTQTDLGRFDDAQRNLDAAFAIRTATLPPGHTDLALSHSGLGDLARKRRDFKGALAHYAAAMAINDKAFGKDSPNLFYDLANLGEASLDAGDVAAARDYLARALARAKAANPAPAALASVYFAQARATSDRSAADKARALYVSAVQTPSTKEELAAIDAWLRK
jgi:serine/threonine protein kinase/Tfp pilus assembly protein PilF